MLEWWVWYFNFNAKRIEKYNVFAHGGFLDDCKKIARKCKDDKYIFAETLRRSAMYFFWAKCEWEIVICGFPPAWDGVRDKIDVFAQLTANWDAFVDYVWDHAAELRRREKKK